MFITRVRFLVAVATMRTGVRRDFDAMEDLRARLGAAALTLIWMGCLRTVPR
jgi:hypothetical protein